MKMTIELDGITAGTLEVARVARAQQPKHDE